MPTREVYPLTTTAPPPHLARGEREIKQIWLQGSQGGVHHLAWKGPGSPGTHWKRDREEIGNGSCTLPREQKRFANDDRRGFGSRRHLPGRRACFACSSVSLVGSRHRLFFLLFHITMLQRTGKAPNLFPEKKWTPEDSYTENFSSRTRV